MALQTGALFRHSQFNEEVGMRKISALLVAVVAGTLLQVPGAVAQTPAPMGPPKVLNIIREEVKPGKGYAHYQHEAAWAQALIKAKYPTHYLGIASLTGPSEDWFLTGFDSFAAWEKDNKNEEENAAVRNVTQGFSAKESEYVSETRVMTARFRPDLSYQPGIRLGEYRYFSVTIVHCRVGHDPDEVSKILNAAREKTKSDVHVAAYQVNSGMPAGTYIYFQPLKSLSEWDEPPNPAYGEALKEGGFWEAVEKNIAKADFRLFAISPRMSFPSESTAAVDPAFWHPKPMSKPAAPAKAAPMKEEKKD
jgi:hypothetical protein